VSLLNPDTSPTTSSPRAPRQRHHDRATPVADTQIASGDAFTSNDAPGADGATEETTGTTALAHHLTDPDTETAIQALAAQAPTMTEDQRTHLARLLHLHPHHTGHPPTPRPPDTPPGS